MTRFVSIWFKFLETDWYVIKKPSLQAIPFVLARPDHGRKVVAATNQLAEKKRYSSRHGRG